LSKRRLNSSRLNRGLPSLLDSNISAKSNDEKIWLAPISVRYYYPLIKNLSEFHLTRSIKREDEYNVQHQKQSRFFGIVSTPTPTDNCSSRFPSSTPIQSHPVPFFPSLSSRPERRFPMAESQKLVADEGPLLLLRRPRSHLPPPPPKLVPPPNLVGKMGGVCVGRAAAFICQPHAPPSEFRGERNKRYNCLVMGRKNVLDI